MRRHRSRQRYRRTVQLSVLALLVAIPLLSLTSIGIVQGTLCSVGIGSVGVTCPVGAIQTFLASRELYYPLLLSASVFVILAFIMGRVFCSWICPQHLVSEMGDKARTALGRNDNEGADSARRYRRGRILLLSALAVGLVASFALGVPAICYICPIGIICRSIVGATMYGRIGAEVLVIVAIVAAEVTIARRGWCKYLCPVGALYGLCTTKHSLKPRRRKSLCVGCQGCERACPMGNAPLSNQVESTCTNCALCIDQCPEGALNFGFRDHPGA